MKKGNNKNKIILIILLAILVLSILFMFLYRQATLKYDCKNGKCIQTNNGKYDNSNCNNKCVKHNKYDCDDGKCIQTNNGKYDNSNCDNKCSCIYDGECGSKCCNNQKCGDCGDIGPIPNDLTDPMIQKFTKYLQQKLKKSLKTNAKQGGVTSDPAVTFDPSIEFGIGIYIKNTPKNRGPVKVWSNWCGAGNKDLCNTQNEKSYYFGSGTKPLTSAMVVGQIFKLWRKTYPNKDVSEFLTFYGGKDIHGAPPSVTYSDLFKMTNGFEKSKFTETVTQPSNTQIPTSGKPITQTMQEWLFCCPDNGLIKSCPGNTSLYCSNSCEKICPVPLDTQKYGGKCASPFCPDNICTWTRYSDYKNTPATIDPNSLPFVKGIDCTCTPVNPTEYQNILQNLSIYDVSMMRSGIPDSDSAWLVDASALLSSRTRGIGPVQFASEILGFDWKPNWKKSDNSYVPNTESISGSVAKFGKIKKSTSPPAQYSSNAFTFLGILLWLLYDTKGETKDWTNIDLNSLLPRRLQHMINFAGTSGNGGSKYFDYDNFGNKYYSFEKTIDLGNVSHPNTQSSDDTQSIIDKTQTDRTHVIANIYNRDIRSTYLPINTPFADWDSSSGVSCGNGWGKCSDMAEIYMNILSPNADNPVMGKEIQKIFTEQFTNYNGSNSMILDNNRIRSPFCSGSNAWGQDSTYNCGVMGPDWFYFMDYNETGYIPCYGHLGSTDGFNSCHTYFPGGVIKPYPPWANDKTSYNNKNWTVKFDFCGKNEFTLSCTQNSVLTESDGPIQQFIWEVLNDPFNWNTGTWKIND